MAFLKSVFATRQGISHEAMGIPCQDAIVTNELMYSHKGSVMVLCDGAGSYEQSHVTANLVAEKIANDFKYNFDELWKLSEEELKERILNNAIEVCHENDVKADCTLLVCAMNIIGERILVHIGDGYILGCNGVESYILMNAENGEEPNQTYFLSGKHALEHLYVRKEKNFNDVVILFSDGVGVSLVQHDGSIAHAVEKMYEWMNTYETEVVTEALQKGLEESFCHHSNDDLSLGVMCIDNGKRKYEVDRYPLEIKRVEHTLEEDRIVVEYEIENYRKEYAYQDFLSWLEEQYTIIQDISIWAPEAYHLGFAVGGFYTVEEALEYWPEMLDSIKSGAGYSINVRGRTNGLFHSYGYGLGRTIWEYAYDEPMIKLLLEE